MSCRRFESASVGGSSFLEIRAKATLGAVYGASLKLTTDLASQRQGEQVSLMNQSARHREHGPLLGNRRPQRSSNDEGAVRSRAV
jgi:hypothetical protein